MPSAAASGTCAPASAPDGSYQGSWEINFTYAACFVTEALLTAGVPASDPSPSRTVSWLRQRQKPDGGWGEHYTSCLSGRYAEHPDSQAAMTAWALLVLRRTAGPATRRTGAPCTAWRACSSTAPAVDGPARRQAASSSRPPSWTTACTKTSSPPGPRGRLHRVRVTSSRARTHQSGR